MKGPSDRCVGETDGARSFALADIEATLHALRGTRWEETARVQLDRAVKVGIIIMKYRVLRSNLILLMN